MIATRSSLLALASSLDAQGDALKAQAASIRAQLEGGEAVIESAANIVNVETHARLVGCSERKSREFMLRAERAGFAVSRVGRGLFMARDEWRRAVDAMNSNRRPRSAQPTPPSSNAAPTADELLDAVGARPLLKKSESRPSRT